MEINIGKALRKVAGSLVELDNTPANPTASQAAPVKSASSFTPPRTTPAPAPACDPEMLSTLQKQIMARTSPYTTLVESAEKIADVEHDEAKRLKIAFKMISSDGKRTVSSISQAIDVHISDIEGARMRFKQASDQQMKFKSGTLRDQAAKLEKDNTSIASTIEGLHAQIQNLTEQAQKNTELIAELNAKASDAEAEIVATANAFEQTADYLKNDLLSKKESITSVLSS